MSRESDRRESGDEHRRAPGPDAPQQPARRVLCETILSVLDRDQHLRHNYLRQRWQGLVE